MVGRGLSIACYPELERICWRYKKYVSQGLTQGFVHTHWQYDVIRRYGQTGNFAQKNEKKHGIMDGIPIVPCIFLLNLERVRDKILTNRVTHASII